MTRREFDIVVYGASGFTGKHVVKYLAQVGSHLKFALAGRSAGKIKQSLPLELQGDDVPPILEADVFDEVELRQIVRKAKVVLNCVGPYRFYGEPVVKACIAEKTDYLDISGEPEFIEGMFVKYFQQAKEAGVAIVPACGFDSIPTDLGVLYIKRTLEQKQVTPCSMEMFFQLLSGPEGSAGNIGTYESLVHALSSTGKLKQIRKQIELPSVPKNGPALKFTHWPHYDARVKSWLIPFLFADPSIVRLSQRLIEAGVYRQNKPQPTQFAAYVKMPNIFACFGFVLYGMLFALVAQFEWGRKFLLKYPELVTLGGFTRRGPTPVQIMSTKFKSTFVVKGFTTERRPNAWTRPDYEAVFSVQGPEPGYVTTPICMVQAALALLEKKDRVPSGVLTPSVAFGETGLIEKLQSEGVIFKAE